MVRRNLVILIGLVLAACGGGGGGGSTAAPPPAPAVVAAADINILMLGNSHTTGSGLHTMVAAMVRALKPGQTVALDTPGNFFFLDERISHPETLDTFRSRKWQYVVLQAQKYSTSGQFVYSTTAAEQFVRMTKAQGGTAVMFPEWPRRGIDETLTIYNIHKGIAEREGACVAAVGQAWDLSEQRRPALVLHADDGNHSAPNGAFLAALVISATITGESPLKVGNLPAFPVGVDDQAFFRQVAADTVAQLPGRSSCS